MTFGKSSKSNERSIGTKVIAGLLLVLILAGAGFMGWRKTAVYTVEDIGLMTPENAELYGQFSDMSRGKSTNMPPQHAAQVQEKLAEMEFRAYTGAGYYCTLMWEGLCDYVFHFPTENCIPLQLWTREPETGVITRQYVIFLYEDYLDVEVNGRYYGRYKSDEYEEFLVWFRELMEWYV